MHCINIGSIQYKLSAAVDILINLVRTGTLLTETPISIFAEMLSGLLDLDVSSSCNRSRSSSSVHNSSSELKVESVTIDSSCEKGVREVLKQL